MADLIKVGMADYKVGRSPSTLISYGLGSCIGVSLYDPIRKIGGLLHIMLPDSTQARASDNPAKFADTGIPLMINDVVALGATRARLVANFFLGRGLRRRCGLCPRRKSVAGQSPRAATPHPLIFVSVGFVASRRLSCGAFCLFALRFL